MQPQPAKGSAADTPSPQRSSMPGTNSSSVAGIVNFPDRSSSRLPTTVGSLIPRVATAMPASGDRRYATLRPFDNSAAESAAALSALPKPDVSISPHLRGIIEMYNKESRSTPIEKGLSGDTSAQWLKFTKEQFIKEFAKCNDHKKIEICTFCTKEQFEWVRDSFADACIAVFPKLHQSKRNCFLSRFMEHNNLDRIKLLNNIVESKPEGSSLKRVNSNLREEESLRNRTLETVLKTASDSDLNGIALNFLTDQHFAGLNKILITIRESLTQPRIDQTYRLLKFAVFLIKHAQVDSCRQAKKEIDALIYKVRLTIKYSLINRVRDAIEKKEVPTLQDEVLKKCEADLKKYSKAQDSDYIGYCLGRELLFKCEESKIPELINSIVYGSLALTNLKRLVEILALTCKKIKEDFDETTKNMTRRKIAVLKLLIEFIKVHSTQIDLSNSHLISVIQSALDSKEPEQMALGIQLRQTIEEKIKEGTVPLSRTVSKLELYLKEKKVEEPVKFEDVKKLLQSNDPAWAINADSVVSDLLGQSIKLLKAIPFSEVLSRARTKSENDAIDQTQISDIGLFIYNQLDEEIVSAQRKIDLQDPRNQEKLKEAPKTFSSKKIRKFLKDNLTPEQYKSKESTKDKFLLYIAHELRDIKPKTDSQKKASLQHVSPNISAQIQYADNLTAFILNELTSTPLTVILFIHIAQKLWNERDFFSARIIIRTLVGVESKFKSLLPESFQKIYNSLVVKTDKKKEFAEFVMTNDAANLGYCITLDYMNNELSELSETSNFDENGAFNRAKLVSYANIHKTLLAVKKQTASARPLSNILSLIQQGKGSFTTKPQVA